MFANVVSYLVQNLQIFLRNNLFVHQCECIRPMQGNPRESKAILDSGLHAVDSGFSGTESGFFVSGTWIPDSDR